MTDQHPGRPDASRRSSREWPASGQLCSVLAQAGHPHLQNNDVLAGAVALLDSRLTSGTQEAAARGARGERTQARRQGQECMSGVQRQPRACHPPTRWASWTAGPHSTAADPLIQHTAGDAATGLAERAAELSPAGATGDGHIDIADLQGAPVALCGTRQDELVLALQAGRAGTGGGRQGARAHVARRAGGARGKASQQGA